MNRVWTKNFWDNVITPIVSQGNGESGSIIAAVDAANARIDAIMARVLNSANGPTNGFDIHGANKDNVLTTESTFYTINGKPYVKTATAEIVTPAAAQQAALKHAYYLCMVDVGGNLTWVKGTDAASAAAATVPAITASTAVLGMVLVSLANAATFTLGTTAFDAIDVTATFYPGTLYSMVGPALTALGATGIPSTALAVANMRKGMGGS